MIAIFYTDEVSWSALGAAGVFLLLAVAANAAGVRQPWASCWPMGIVFGLVLGKPLGITLFSWLAVRSGLAELPQGVTWRLVHGVAWLGGIGFTMSLFVAGLAFPGGPELLTAAKIGVLAASVAAGLGGWLLLWRAGSQKRGTA